jgi:hypothetical protein
MVVCFCGGWAGSKLRGEARVLAKTGLAAVSELAEASGLRRGESKKKEKKPARGCQ